MAKFWNWLKANPVILVCIIVGSFETVGVFAGVLSPQAASVGFLAAAAMSARADQAERHKTEILAALDAVAKAGADYRTGGTKALVADIQHDFSVLSPGATPSVGQASQYGPMRIDGLGASTTEPK